MIFAFPGCRLDVALATLWRESTIQPQKLQVLVAINSDLCWLIAGRESFQAVLRPDRTFFKATTTIGAGIVKQILDTPGAESTFKRANHGLG